MPARSRARTTRQRPRKRTRTASLASSRWTGPIPSSPSTPMQTGSRARTLALLAARYGLWCSPSLCDCAMAGHPTSLHLCLLCCWLTPDMQPSFTAACTSHAPNNHAAFHVPAVVQVLHVSCSSHMACIGSTLAARFWLLMGRQLHLCGNAPVLSEKCVIHRAQSIGVGGSPTQSPQSRRSRLSSGA